MPPKEHAPHRLRECGVMTPDKVSRGYTRLSSRIVHGSIEECCEHLHRFVESGVTCPMVALMPVPGEDPADQARALARAWYSN